MKNSFYILCIFFSLNIKAGDSILFKLEVTSTFFTTDNLFNIYFINDKNEIIKFNYVDTSLITYSNKNLGRPVLIDASNPMKLLIFYPDFNSIVLLSNKLAELSIIQLNNFNQIFYQPVAVCKESESDFIWIYDDLTRKLFKLDESGIVVAQSEPFDQLFDFTIQQPKIFSVNDNVFLYAADEGLLVFDTYANYINTFSQLPNELQQVSESYYTSISDGKIIVFNTESTTISEIIYDEKNVLQVNIRGNNFFLRMADSIVIYPIRED